MFYGGAFDVAVIWGLPPPLLLGVDDDDDDDDDDDMVKRWEPCDFM